MANINQWKVGDIISASKLNEMVNAINDLLQQEIPEIDTSNLITHEQLTTILAGYSDVGHTHNISEIVDLVLPTKLSQLENDTDYATITQVNQAIDNAQLGGGEVDLTSYAKKTDLPTKTSQLTNDSGYLTSVPSEYVTESELNAKGYSTFNGDYNNLTNKPTIPSISGLASESYVNEYVENAIKDIPKEEVDLSDYAKKTELPTKLSQLANDEGYIASIPSEYITESELNSKGYLTEHQDISGKADKTELHNHSNKSVLDGINASKVSSWDNKSNFSGNYNDLTNKPSIPTKVSELENDKRYITEAELNDIPQPTNNDYSLGVHTDGGIYLFVNGEPVGLGVFLSNVEISVSDGYVANDNTIMLSDNIPSGTYSMKYENEDGTYSLIGNFEI